MRKLTLKIEQDSEPQSPREFSNLGKMVCFHGRYELGDKHSLTPTDAKALYAKVLKDGGVALPLFLYDHSGITMSVSPFSCPWDSGQVGFIYADKEMILKMFGKSRMVKGMKGAAEEQLKQEVATYDQYLTGDVHGYTILDEEGEVVDSCWGFYGLADAQAQGKEALEAQNKWEAEQMQAVKKIMAL